MLTHLKTALSKLLRTSLSVRGPRGLQPGERRGEEYKNTRTMGANINQPLLCSSGTTMSQIHKQMHTYTHKERESCETVWLKSFILRHTWMDRWRCRMLMHSPAESSESGSPSPRVSGPTCPGRGQRRGGGRGGGSRWST